MTKGGCGGGKTKTGLTFEQKSDFIELLKSKPGYEILGEGRIGNDIYFKKKKIATQYRKHDLYNFLKQKNIKWEECISSKLLPDDAVLVQKTNTLFILEIKYQQVQGSVDEKLQTCDFKLKQYRKLFSNLNIKVEYIYILNSWFEKPKYKDVLKYIKSVYCSYYFEFLPLKCIGLPI